MATSEWRNRQTRQPKELVPARAWGFKSPLRHHIPGNLPRMITGTDESDGTERCSGVRALIRGDQPRAGSSR